MKDASFYPLLPFSSSYRLSPPELPVQVICHQEDSHSTTGKSLMEDLCD